MKDANIKIEINLQEIKNIPSKQDFHLSSYNKNLIKEDYINNLENPNKVINEINNKLKDINLENSN